jgi:flagellin
MPLSINTNVASMTAQRSFLNSNADLETAFERLSTGKRVNSAVDDAAGLAIGKGLESRVSGLNQAVRNVNDGISMVQIAEGSLDEVTSILQRMRDLAVQAANGSLSSTEQGYLDSEQAKLATTLGTTIDQTKFNNKDLVNDTTATSITIQSGADSVDTTSISFSAMTETSLGVAATAIQLSGDTTKVSSVSFEDYLGNTAVKGVLTAAGFDAKLASGGTGTYSVTLDGSTFTTGTIAAPSTLLDLAAALNAVSGVSDLGTFRADGTALDFDANAAGAIAGSITSAGFTNNVSGTTVNFTNETLGKDHVETSGDGKYTLTVGSETFVTAADTGKIGTTNKGVATLVQTAVLAAGVTNFTVGTAGDLDNGAITLTYNSGTVSEGTYTLAKTAGTEAQIQASGAGTQATVSVSNANDAITTIDAALATVASERASLGATQAQLESTVRNLANVAENTAAAAGRIMDTDYAAETANLTKAQILQQAATSILAQANAQPQGILSLLQ